MKGARCAFLGEVSGSARWKDGERKKRERKGKEGEKKSKIEKTRKGRGKRKMKERKTILTSLSPTP